ncbi:MAG TPA: hypothetical protein VJR02_26875 [Pyrinomonadaceae bacterium]|nr:hypothetical protein [Pyrinomonadaceae bacterium]
MNTNFFKRLSRRIPRLSARLAIAALTFIIGISLTAWLFFTTIYSRFPNREQLENVSVCEVARVPGKFEGRRVRLQGSLVGFHELALYDPSCHNVDNYIRVDLDQSSRTELVRLANKLENGGLQDGNFMLKAELVGRVESIPESSLPLGNELRSPQPVSYRARVVVFSVDRVEQFEK